MKRTILGVVLVLLFTIQFTAFAVVHVARDEEWKRYRAENDERRLRFENEMRALATAPCNVDWPTSSAVAVRIVDLADGVHLYDGRAVLVALRNWRQHEEKVQWFRWATDEKPTVEFILEPNERPVGKVLWIEGTCAGDWNGKIVIVNCRVHHAQTK